MKRKLFALALGGAALLLAWILGVPLPSRANPGALWFFVKICRAEAKPTAPCIYHDAHDKFTIIKDISRWKTTAYLLTPTDRVHGIESPLIFTEPVAEFWHFGWVEAVRYLGRPPERIGLAINSVVGRSQNQLHIHLSCAKPSVVSALARARVTNRWGAAPFVHVVGQTYNVIRTDSLSGADSPFRLVAQLPGARADMRDRTIAVIGAPGGRSFYILADFAHGADPGSAEDLLDESCSHAR
jgi:CDP-diacylglycerol pyrophosphatase